MNRSVSQRHSHVLFLLMWALPLITYFVPNVPCLAQPPKSDVPAKAPATELAKEISSQVGKVVTAFNNGDTSALLDGFLPDAELIDELGNVYSGHQEIEDLVKAFFKKHPKAQTSAELDSVRQIGSIVLADGARMIASADGKSIAYMRFHTVWTKVNNRFKIASFRDVEVPTLSTPNEALQSLAWLIGEWVSEGADAKVSIKYRWSEDTNFILGEYSLRDESGELVTSTLRFGWDATKGLFRAWSFDTDGGFGESLWTQTNEGWTIQSTAVTPDGLAGSAQLTLVVESENRFTIRGTNRILDGQTQPDYDIVIVKKPPVANIKQ